MSIRRWLPRSLVLSILCAAFLWGTWQIARTSRFQLLGDWVRHVPVEEPLLALSFDDGPHPIYTEQILALLEAHDARASFFMVGEQVAKHPEVARAVLDAGHEIGNHSWSHERMLLRSPGWMREEIAATDGALRTVGVRGTIHFRPPFGKKLLVLPWVLSRQDRLSVLFDVIPNPPDYLEGDPELIAADIQARARPGSIVVLHDGGGERRETVEATRLVLERMGAEGWRFVTVSELLEAGRGPHSAPSSS